MNNNTNTKGILIGTVLVILALVVGYYLGQLSADSTFKTAVRSVAGGNQETTTATSSDTGTAAVTTASLSPEQRVRLEAYGIDPDRITPAMVACAQAKLGVARYGEVIGGAELSASEKITLVACYRP